MIHRVKSVTNAVAVFASCVGLLVITPGCSHQNTAQLNALPEAVQDRTTPMQKLEYQFMQDVAGLPVSQREAYVEAHVTVFNDIKTDPDQSKLRVLQSLLQQRAQ